MRRVVSWGLGHRSGGLTKSYAALTQISRVIPSCCGDIGLNSRIVEIGLLRNRVVSLFGNW